ncbi:tripartite tricarboxylate transporter TctB family protein [Bifidobacterium sp. 82T24]|uniref:tripartite tricarboxylate transporter TctB family protein n=1 Tax=Bifidobacterium pluvialisilvae TaxID=2834436 RepID=UPI001C561533|nr:tripartite tricarboxylate transporter TctB family protein [Bifidobacterium pluvialisilvae]MBW3088170.1 tripartite tricarboxylate transporter TctB family protein [Bifidobacterium pluvialisilvae]
MPNRAERRANAKRSRKGAAKQPVRYQAKSRQGMVDEYSLQERSIRLQDGQPGEWKPSAKTDLPVQATSSVRQPRKLSLPHTARGWIRFFCWLLIVLSAMAFFVVMWIPNMPTWSVIVVSAVFAVGVLSLFFVSGDPRDNPNVDEYGTAV